MVLIKLEDGTMAQCYLTEITPSYEGCDKVLEYDLYNADGVCIDGGMYEFVSTDKHLLEGLAEFIKGKRFTKYEVLVATEERGYSSIQELVEEEFKTSFKTAVLINKLDSEILKNDIRALCKHMRR